MPLCRKFSFHFHFVPFWSGLSRMLHRHWHSMWDITLFVSYRCYILRTCKLEISIHFNVIHSFANIRHHTTRIRHNPIVKYNLFTFQLISRRFISNGPNCSVELVTNDPLLTH